MESDIEKIIADKPRLESETAKAAKWLDKRCLSFGGTPLAICVLKGSVFFFCDLVRAMATPVRIDFITVSSYGDGAHSSKEIKIVSDISSPVRGQDVIIVEDIVDTGFTLGKLKELMLSRGAKSVTIITLFDKPSRREADISADYSCMEAGDEFIVGYGLDYAQKYRDLPYVGVLRREIYEK